jgi:hypothetical protein
MVENGGKWKFGKKETPILPTVLDSTIVQFWDNSTFLISSIIQLSETPFAIHHQTFQNL